MVVSKSTYISGRYKSADECLSDDESEDETEAAIEDLEENIHLLQQENIELHSKCEELSAEVIETFEKGQYNTKVRKCCYDLLCKYDVSVNNVESVIRTVVRELTGRKVDKLPSRSKLAEMRVEGRSVAHIQLAEQLSSTADVTLHSDGTTKFSTKYGSFQVCYVADQFS